MRLSLLVAAILLPAAACAARAAGAPPRARPEPPAEERSALREGTSASGRYTVRWRAVEGAVPMNEPFELEVLLEADGAPAPGAHIVVRGWMPDHGHGMLRNPEVIDRGDGSYLVRGMLLHMTGLWQLFVDVYEPGERKDRTTFEVVL